MFFRTRFTSSTSPSSSSHSSGSGGVAGNIAYNLGLLGQPCRLVGTVGNDFDEYRQELDHLEIDMSGVVVLDDLVTASAFITTDRADNQITGFFPGAMANAGEYSILDRMDGATVAVVSPTAPAAMRRHVDELREAGLPYLFDPGQQVVALSADDLRAGVEGAELLAANDYELALIEDKLELTREEILEQVKVVAVTFGDLGSAIHVDGTAYEIPPSGTWRVVDPTGAGDGYRAGLIAGYVHGIDWEATGRIASVAATYVVEQRVRKHTATRGMSFESASPQNFPTSKALSARCLTAPATSRRVCDPGGTNG
ncbi:MAG: carbohydrate kinase family protein [Thermomicrobiales bacterium]